LTYIELAADHGLVKTWSGRHQKLVVRAIDVLNDKVANTPVDLQRRLKGFSKHIPEAEALNKTVLGWIFNRGANIALERYHIPSVVLIQLVREGFKGIKKQ
jgi:hypothetical protein